MLISISNCLPSWERTNLYMAEKKKTKQVSIKNKRAEFDYILLDKYTAGIVLTGTEIKSIRAGKAGLTDTFCMVIDEEVWVKNMYVAEYLFGSYNNHVTHRDRKLLLQRSEIRKIAQDLKKPGLTLVPTLLYIDENGRAKMEIRLCKGKKQYDKRQALKDKMDKREMERQVKRF